MTDWSARAQYTFKRTYAREIEQDSGIFETWDDTVGRVIDHQHRLWREAKKRRLNAAEKAELEELRKLMLQRIVMPAGRTLWLGGTDVAFDRAASQFNCSFTSFANINDVVDIFWLLLQGCGVGFKPVVGSLFGFSRPIENIQIIESERTEKGGDPRNHESYNSKTETWTLRIGDSAEAWAKAVGKLLAHPYPAKTLVIDFSQVRPAGSRLSRYGWISSGHQPFADAMRGICLVLNERAGEVLRAIDALDIINYLGTCLSSRRSAQIALLDYGHPEWEDFALAKKDYWLSGNNQRAQSNNSLVFWDKPSKAELHWIFQLMQDAGGSEPGFINGASSLARAPYYAGTNPCGEILLPEKGFCNLVTMNVGRFDPDDYQLDWALNIIARANYRQTCVDLRDGVLQDQWHHNNHNLRLTGVSLTGQAMAGFLSPGILSRLRKTAQDAVNDMADDLGLPRSKNVTTVKPEGTQSKLMDCTEGLHMPLGKYIFNNIMFGEHDPNLETLEAAGYKIVDHPLDKTAKLVTFPVAWESVAFDHAEGKDVNLESAVDQLERYKTLMDNYVDHNASITVSYDPDEIPDMVRWLDNNWDSYVGVSFLYRTDPTKTAEDLGYPYLPQQVVTEKEYADYVSKLKPVDVVGNSTEELLDDGCSTGACPVR